MGILLLFAGHETTANMIALGTVALLQHPDQLEKLRMSEDPALVGSAVEELLRYLSIIHDGLKRTVTADTVVGDVTIPAGEGVIVGLEFANRDPEVFPEASELDLERNPRNHVAFGFGVHQCLGQPLARMELQVVYPTLIRRLPELRLAVPLEQIRFKHDAVIYGVHELPIEW
jgi:cytochrome P450